MTVSEMADRRDALCALGDMSADWDPLELLAALEAAVSAARSGEAPPLCPCPECA